MEKKVKTWRKPDTNEDPFDLSLESLLQRAEEAEERSFEDMQELLFQREKMERKEGWKRKTSDKRQAFHIRSVFQKARSGQKNVRKLLLAMVLCLVIGGMSGGIEANGGFQVGLWMQNRHGVSYLKGEMADRYECKNINEIMREISEELDGAVMQFDLKEKQKIICTKMHCDKVVKTANIDVSIDDETYHIEYVKAKESTSYTHTEDLIIVDNLKMKNNETAEICVWENEKGEKSYYAYIVNGATMITIGTSVSLERLRKVLMMLTIE